MFIFIALHIADPGLLCLIMKPGLGLKN